MSSKAYQLHKHWFERAVLVLLVTGLADCAAAFAPRPLLWCSLIAGTLPLTLIFFVAFPLMREQSPKS
jgi:hypothetical protein